MGYSQETNYISLISLMAICIAPSIIIIFEKIIIIFEKNNKKREEIVLS